MAKHPSPHRRHRAARYSPRQHDLSRRAELDEAARGAIAWADALGVDEGAGFYDPTLPGDTPSLQDVTADELLRIDAEAFGV